MKSKKNARLRRALRARARISQLDIPRLTVHRTLRHIYAQIIQPGGGATVVSASTLEPGLRGKLKNCSNVAAAELVGQVLAEKAQAAGIEQVAFDRSGFKYHGRVKAVADAARSGGLKF